MTGKTLKKKVLASLKRLATATDDELEEYMGLPHTTLSARRRELVLAGYVRDSGTKRLTRGGRNATVWQVVPEADRASCARTARLLAKASATPAAPEPEPAAPALDPAVVPELVRLVQYMEGQLYVPPAWKRDAKKVLRAYETRNAG